MPTKKTVKKTKNVLIISASFRPNSNSHALCQEVAKGVKAAGNKAEVIRLKDKKIGFCTGCYACQKLGKCVIKDDANAIVEKICKADAVVFGTPVYYFSIAGQLKALFEVARAERQAVLSRRDDGREHGLGSREGAAAGLRRLLRGREDKGLPQGRRRLRTRRREEDEVHEGGLRSRQEDMRTGHD